MLTGLALSAAVGLALGSRYRAAMLLMSSLLVLLGACAAQWDDLAVTGEGFWTLLRIWLHLAAHQLGFVAGACLPADTWTRERAALGFRADPLASDEPQQNHM